jgi:thiamine-phosphate pyrophosphorylase
MASAAAADAQQVVPFDIRAGSTTMSLPEMRGLYPIVDVDALRAAGVDPLAFAREIVLAGPAVVQLRAKRETARATLDLLRRLLPVCHDAGVKLFANDRPDLALLAGCDGVHVGQEDLDVDEVRRVAPGLLVGVSTHDFAQLERALEARPDYVAFGPVFATRTKENPDPVVGIDGLARAHDRARADRTALCAIGGIDEERLGEVSAHAELVAVIGELVPRGGEGLDDVGARALAMVRRIGASA